MGELLFSSIGAGATKLKPLKSWWALALGGIPGESAHTKDHSYYRHVNIHTPTTCCQCSDAVSMAAGVVFKYWNRTVCMCGFLPLGVLAVNSGSKQNVSSGLPAAGLNGGWSSLLYSFCRRYGHHTHTH